MSDRQKVKERAGIYFASPTDLNFHRFAEALRIYWGPKAAARLDLNGELMVCWSDYDLISGLDYTALTAKQIMFFSRHGEVIP